MLLIQKGHAIMKYRSLDLIDRFSVVDVGGVDYYVCDGVAINDRIDFMLFQKKAHHENHDLDVDTLIKQGVVPGFTTEPQGRMYRCKINT